MILSYAYGSLYYDGWKDIRTYTYTPQYGGRKAFCVFPRFAQVRMNDDGWLLFFENFADETARYQRREEKNLHWPFGAIFVESLSLSSMLHVWRLQLRTAAVQTVDKEIIQCGMQGALIDIENRIGSIMVAVIYHFFA